MSIDSKKENALSMWNLMWVIKIILKVWGIGVWRKKEDAAN
ncbi:hypothetical protein ACPUYX_13305 [Desulfosporosinus sp. SYSU MS00001]